jgi:hypothetical protein
MGRPHICSPIGVNHHKRSKRRKGNKLRTQYMAYVYLLSKYLAVISNSSHATHVLVTARPRSLEGDFAFFENIDERRALRNF